MKKMIPLVLIWTAVVTPAPSQIPPSYAAPSFATGRPAAPPVPPPATPAPGQSSLLIRGYVDETNYILRAGDTVSFQILEDRLLELQLVPTSLTVADSGELDVPYIGRIMSAGKTSKQLAAEIKTGLEKGYYKQATVVLSLNLANRLWGRVYLMGQVHLQGALDVQVNENITAGKAIMRAGGFLDFANKKKVKVVRADLAGKTQIFELDMKKILEEGIIEKDMALEPNDLIIVSSRLINF